MAQLFITTGSGMNHVMQYRSDFPLQLCLLDFQNYYRSIKLSGFFSPNIRLKYCSEEAFFSQATFAINASCIEFLILSENSDAKAKELQ